jgi:hypothetical protein
MSSGWWLKRHYKMTAKRGTSSVAALVMARAQKQLAEKYPHDDPELMADATELERRALEAIKQGLPDLPEVKKPAAQRLATSLRGVSL